MSIPQLNVDNIVQIVEQETQLDWEMTENRDSVLELQTEVTRLVFSWDGGAWRIDAYDFASADKDEPIKSLTNLRTVLQVERQLPSFIPSQLKV